MDEINAWEIYFRNQSCYGYALLWILIKTSGENEWYFYPRNHMASQINLLEWICVADICNSVWPSQKEHFGYPQLVDIESSCRYLNWS